MVPANQDIFQIKVLDSRDARLAYPLVRIAHPTMSLAAWLAFARRWTRLSPRRGGLSIVKDRRGYVHAMYTYRVDHNLRLGKFLRIADLIVGHLGSQMLANEILRAADRIAGNAGCSAIVIEPSAINETPMLVPGNENPFSYLRSLPLQLAPSYI